MLTIYLVQPTGQSAEFVHKGSGYYTYAPSCIYDGGCYYTYYCSNKNMNEVKDYIYVTRSLPGHIRSERINVLTPSKDGWDSMHVCDATVVRQNCTYDGQDYRYIMAYLGCDRGDNQNNQIGLAVSSGKTSTFVKIDSNPIISVPFVNDPDVFEWGVGQPSLIATDEGTLIFYTVGDATGTYEMAELWNLDNLNNPKMLWQTEVSVDGLVDYISNADYAVENDKLYMICDNHDYFGNVPETSAVYVTRLSEYTDLASCEWTLVETVDHSLQNHNCGFVRTADGSVFKHIYLYTTADKISNWKQNLMSYEIRWDYF